MIIKAAWVLPVSRPPLRAGFVQFASGRITALGLAADAPPDDPQVIDLGAVALLPGLVNCHTHLELTCYAGRLDPAPLWEWLRQLVLLRLAPGQLERERLAAAEGAWQSLRAGVTCVGDISRRNVHWRALRPIPIRKVCFVELLSLADDPPRNLDELRAAVAEVAEDALLTVGVTPHAPYTVPLDEIRGALGLAGTLRRPWCLHWAEAPEESAFLQGEAGALPGFLQRLLAQCGIESPRQPPMAVLESCAAHAPPGLLAHCNYVADGDAERLAGLGHTVVFCPRSHRFFGHPPHPYRTLADAGVPVAIGTDSAASNESLSLLDELRFLRTQTPDPPNADTLLEMVTLTAARALKLDAQVGSIESGKQADLAAFPCDPDAADPAAALIDAAPPAAGVWVAGENVL